MLKKTKLRAVACKSEALVVIELLGMSFLYCVMAYVSLRKVLVSFLQCWNLQQDNAGLGMNRTE
jgi:hypothetical protein